MKEPISIHACDHIYVKDAVVGATGVTEKVIYVYCKEMGEYIYISPLSENLNLINNINYNTNIFGQGGI